MNWYVTTDSYAEMFQKNAGSKAPADIVEICRKCGMRPLIFHRFPMEKRSILYKKMWLLTVGIFPWIKLFLQARKGDIIILPHPFQGNRFRSLWIPFMRKWKGCRFVALIHDIGILRNNGNNFGNKIGKTALFADGKLLKKYDAVICHNDRMKKYLSDKGLSSDRIVCLEIFDYLTETNAAKRKWSVVPSIVIAGNLNRSKSGYIYEIDLKSNSNLIVHLYGRGFDEAYASSKMSYHGAFEPEELPAHLEGDFGLVWDGTSIKTCAGSTGEYLRYNNPHKLSLYLASNMPVIVWEDAAAADFVLSRKVGFTVKALDEIPEKIRKLSADEYERMCAAAGEEGKKLRNGYYTKKALRQALEIARKSMC